MNPKLLSVLKSVTMLAALLFLVGFIFNFYHNKMVEKKENRQTVYLMNEVTGKIHRNTAAVVDKHLVENDCWVVNVTTDRSGKIVGADYFCFKDMTRRLSSHYNEDRSFKKTHADVKENDLESKSAYLILGKEKFCSVNPDHQFCAKKTGTS